MFLDNSYLLIVILSQGLVHEWNGFAEGAGKNSEGNVDHLQVFAAGRGGNLAWAGPEKKHGKIQKSTINLDMFK